MPNWVYNDLTVEGNPTMVSLLKDKMNSSFTIPVETHGVGDLTYNIKQVTYSNPVFAFHNIYNFRDAGITDEEYATQPARSELSPNDKGWWADTNRLRIQDKSWYSWNITNWGTKWDVAVSDDEKWPDTELIYDDANGENQVLVYKFQTAWGIADEALIRLSKQFPTLLFTLKYEEETGWGGEREYLRGRCISSSEYGWCCRECGHEEDETPYCEDCDFDMCPSCGYGEPNDEDRDTCDIHHKVEA